MTFNYRLSSPASEDLRFRQWNTAHGKYQQLTAEATGWEGTGQWRVQRV